MREKRRWRETLTRSAQSFPIPPAFFLSPRSDQATLLGSTDPRPARSPDVVAGATSGLLSPFFVAPVHQQTFDSSEVVYLLPAIVRRPSSRSAGSKRRVKSSATKARRTVPS